MVRSIMPRLIQAPRIDFKANADKTWQLKEQAAKLHELARLSNEADPADRAAPAASGLVLANSSSTPHETIPVSLKAARDGAMPGESARHFSLTPVNPDAPAPPADKIASEVIDDLEAGKSIDEIAADRSMTREQLVAELEAAGYQVKIVDNGDIQSVELDARSPDFVGPQLADKKVYYYDFQHDTGTVVTTKGDTKTTRTTKIASTTTFIDPETGAEVKIVIDKDGRVTKTTTQKINNGNPVDYVIQPGDNLTSIAEKHGVTLDELKRSNPEFFDAPRDPDLIYPGDTVRIESGTRTTVEVTANGYTLTSWPDGKSALHNNATGTDLAIQAGSIEESLARLLLGVNPCSSDPAEAKEGEAVKSFAEAMLAAKTLPSLLEAANQADAETTALIDKYGSGILASRRIDGENNVIDPVGNPPTGKAPSGGNWVPLYVGGVLTWLDPQVAQAINRQDKALSAFNETRALVGQGLSQLDVYMLDPGCADAVAGAEGVLNMALAPYGLGWTPDKPNGTFAEAQDKLAHANALLKTAQDAREAYEAAGYTLDQAIKDQSALTPRIELDQELIGQPEHASEAALEYLGKTAQDIAEHAAVDKQFGKAGVYMSQGEKLRIDFLVGQAEMDGMSKDSTEYKALKSLQEAAAGQLELAEAYQAYFEAHATSLDIDVHMISVDDATNPDVHATSTDASSPRAVLEAKLLAEYNAEHLSLSESETEYTTRGGDYLGKLKSQNLEIRHGQLWLINEWVDEGGDVSTTEVQLTYDAADKNFSEKYRTRQLNLEWQQLLGELGPEALFSEDGLIAVKTAEAQAAKNLNDVLDRTIGNGLGRLEKQLSSLQENYDRLLKNGTGSVEIPPGTLPAAAQPVEVDIDGGRKIKVAPDVAERIQRFGLDAITQSGKAVWIDLDTSDGDAEGRWIDPELAVAKLALEAVQQQKAQIEQLHDLVKGFAAYHETHLKNPSLLIAPGNRSTDNNYLDKDQQAALDGIYQPKFQQLSGSGFDNTFHERRGSELNDIVATTMGIDRSTAEGREAVGAITKEIRDVGGDDPKVCAVPFFSVDAMGGSQQQFLFAVQSKDGTRYVDVTGMSFDGLKDFQDNNTQFGENAKLVVPKDLEMKRGTGGAFELEVVEARNFSVWEQGADALVTGATTVATVLSFVPPLAPVMVPIAYAGTAYLLSRSVFRQASYLGHGGELSDTASLLNLANIATMTLPVFSSSLRFIGMARSKVTPLEALRGSIGAASPGSMTAKASLSFMKSTSHLNRAAWGMDVGAAAIGVPLVAVSAHDIANWEQMDESERTSALINLFSGVVGTGLGIHGLHTLRPGMGGDATRTEMSTADMSASPGDATAPGITSLAASTPSVTLGELDTGTPALPSHRDPSGIAFQAVVLGTGPRKWEDIFVPLVSERNGETAAPPDRYTHYVVFPKDGRAVVLPLIRGGSEDHVPEAVSGAKDDGEPTEGLSLSTEASVPAAPTTDTEGEATPTLINMPPPLPGDASATDGPVLPPGPKVPNIFVPPRSGELPSVFQLLQDYHSPMGISRGHHSIGCDFTSMPDGIVAALSSVPRGPQQPEVLLPEKIALTFPIGLTAEHVNSLDKAALQDLSVGDLRMMSHEDTRRIDLRQIRRLSPEQFEAMGGPYAAFRAPWRKALSTAPVAVSFLLASARAFPEGALVRTLLETASGLAYGVRGLSFVAEATFPNASGAGKPLGKFLRGVRLVTWPVNFANGFAKADTGWAAASLTSNQYGNLGYAITAWRELLTGQRATSWDKRLLGGYLAGAVIDEYTGLQGQGSNLSNVLPQRLSDGLDAVPGGVNSIVSVMIAGGSVHFLCEAVRPAQGKLGKMLVRGSLGGLFGGALLLVTMSFIDGKVEREEPVTGSGEPPPSPDELPTEPDEPGEPTPQFVVTAEDGLNLRHEPDLSSESMVILRPGSLVTVDGDRRFDEEGKEWVLVRAYGPDGKEYRGWVSADHVELHPQGAQDTSGRYNPDLNKQGLKWVEVQPGQSIGSIARMHSVDVSDTVALNMDHILDPNLIFKGDRIYLPASASS